MLSECVHVLFQVGLDRSQVNVAVRFGALLVAQTHAVMTAHKPARPTVHRSAVGTRGCLSQYFTAVVPYKIVSSTRQSLKTFLVFKCVNCSNLRQVFRFGSHLLTSSLLFTYRDTYGGMRFDKEASNNIATTSFCSATHITFIVVTSVTLGELIVVAGFFAGSSVAHVHFVLDVAL